MEKIKKTNNNCRIDFQKNVIFEDKSFDVFTIDTVANNKWFEVSIPFTENERDTKMYKSLKKLFDLATNK